VSSPLDEENHAKLLVELWKQTVAVQQHFNDLCWRIRGLALTALTFTLGAAALAAREPVDVALFGADLRLSVIIIGAGFVLWRAFYYVDRRWYHQLLKGAVKHGEDLERELRTLVPAAGLTTAISDASPYDGRSWRGQRQPIKSTKKLQRFYGVVSLLLLAFAAALQLADAAPEAEEQPRPNSSAAVTPAEPATTTTPPGPHRAAGWLWPTGAERSV
jgi:hypothetical protein